MHDIRRAADVSVGAIYHHFQSKEEIAKAIYEELLEKVTRRFEEILACDETVHDQCRAVMAMLFELTDTKPAEMEFMLFSKHREFMPSAVPVCSSKPLSIMRDLVKRGVERGEIKEMPITLVTTCLFGGMFRLISIRLDGVIEGPLSGYLDSVFECGWKGVAK